MIVFKVTIVAIGLSPLLVYARNLEEVCKVVQKVVCQNIGVAIAQIYFHDDAIVPFYFPKEVPTLTEPSVN